MHRRKLRKYRILKDICAVVGGIAVLVMAGSADSYSQNIISTAEFLLAFGIALDMMIVAYITHDCVKDREKHYLQMREMSRRHRAGHEKECIGTAIPYMHSDKRSS